MKTEASFKLDEEPGGDYDPELYAVGAIADTVDGIGQVTDEDIAFYGEQGYLAIANAFSAEKVKEALEGMQELMLGKCAEFRGLSYERGIADKLAGMTAEERAGAVRKMAGFVEHEPRLNAMAEDSALKGLLKRIMGEEAVLYSDQAMVKPPQLGREKPWHQDHAYFNVELKSRVIGVWIALDRAEVSNGCMHVLPKSHNEPVVHFRRRDWQICDSAILGQKATAVELDPGGLLLFDSLIAHGTPANRSGKRRRALQFHYKRTSAVDWRTKDRLAVFGSDGKDVTC